MLRLYIFTVLLTYIFYWLFEYRLVRICRDYDIETEPVNLFRLILVCLIPVFNLYMMIYSIYYLACVSDHHLLTEFCEIEEIEGEDGEV